MVPEPTRLLRYVTFGLLVAASTATEIAVVEDRWVLTSLGLAVLWAGLAAGLGRLVPVPKDGRRVPPRYVLLVLLGLAATPFFLEPLRRHWTGEGYPLELQMAFALRNLGLGLAAFASWRLCLRLACVVSLFLMLFAVALTNNPAVLTLLGLYGATGSVWLMLTYWTGLERIVARPQVAALELPLPRTRPPWVAVFVVVGLVGVVPGVIAVGPPGAVRVLAEWLPTSGGTGAFDPFARGGVNDGDDETRGENARSTGMTQTETFLDSPLPSLYDLINDLYGEPFKPTEQERTIALDQQNKPIDSRKPPANNLRPNREFPTARKSPRQPRDASDRAARALFEVQGRTPLHVRVTAFDAFDGLAWQEAPLSQHTCFIEKEPKSCWMKVEEREPCSVFAEAETHQFKIASPIGSLVPTPPHLTRFRVGRVDQACFFAWGQDRVLRMAERKTPSAIVVETECRTVDPRLLDALEFPSGVNSDQLHYADLPPNLSPEVVALAHRWADERPRGWPQIAAIVGHLRTEYAIDPAARVPADCHDPLGHFLLQSRRGPDYQFATAAAVLLRVLGYPTRLVTGFYVSPDHYDPQTRHTPVVSEDLHFWVEVMLPSSDWLVTEPTPGYEVLGPNLPLSERVLAGLVAAAHLVWQHVVELGLGLIVLGGLWWRRRELLDAGAVALWWWFPGRTWQQCVRRTSWLLERRGRWAGRPRRASQTLATWLRPQMKIDGSLDQLSRMAEWAAYGPDLTPSWNKDDVRDVCRRALHDWTLRRWRTALATNAP